MNPEPPATNPSERLYEMVGDALDRPAGERAAFLAAACREDAALLAEALSLVEHGQQTGVFLGHPAYALAAGEDLGSLEGGSAKPGDVLGDCRIVCLLGEGGMGEVYLADDTKLERRVAVKLLKQRLDDDTLLRRFRHERKVLAGLTHPNIARLYGGGTTPEGRSYLVMEYVEGERLDRFCEARQLGLTERLVLFRKVCAAVTYAHQNLVVHRDLKPANIRVTPEGEPKLLDFGIAKLLAPEGATTRLDPTLTMAAAMTPEYASPEQIKGEAITTVSDVYSLGVILYELLTGQRPYQLKGRRADEVARAICEEEPPRPSTVVRKRKAESKRQKAEETGIGTSDTISPRTPSAFCLLPSAFRLRLGRPGQHRGQGASQGAWPPLSECAGAFRGSTPIRRRVAGGGAQGHAGLPGGQVRAPQQGGGGGRRVGCPRAGRRFGRGNLAGQGGPARA